MKPLAIVCPSRGRPDPCHRMVESALASFSGDVLVYVDTDDDTRNYYPRDGERLSVYHGPPIGRGQAVNSLIQKFPNYRMYLIVSDDIAFVRNDWEQQVIKAMDAYGDDLGIVHLSSENSERYANWVVASKKWIDTLGWFNYPGCRWFCQDTIIQVLAEALGRIRFIEPKVIHHHVIHDYDVEARMVPDTRAFLWYMAQEFGGDLAKLRAAIGAPDEDSYVAGLWAAMHLIEQQREEEGGEAMCSQREVVALDNAKYLIDQHRLDVEFGRVRPGASRDAPPAALVRP